MTKQRKIIGIIALIVIVVGLLGLFGRAQAEECGPLPTCSSLGYTKTYCSGASVRCPFDLSKKYCL